MVIGKGAETRGYGGRQEKSPLAKPHVPPRSRVAQDKTAKPIALVQNGQPTKVTPQHSRIGECDSNFGDGAEIKYAEAFKAYSRRRRKGLW